MAHFAYLPQEEPWQAILHSMPYEKDTELEHMRHLYSLGFEKAVILKTLRCDFDFHEIHFKEASGMMQSTPKQQSMLPPWPQHQPKRPQGPMYQPDKVRTTPDCSLACGITTDDLMAFFTSSKGTLCTAFENLDMPELCTQHFATLAHHCHFDRLVSMLTDHRKHAADTFLHSRMRKPEHPMHGVSLCSAKLIHPAALQTFRS